MEIKTGAVIGLGNMGRHHLRILNQMGLEIYECDINPESPYRYNLDKFERDYKMLPFYNIDFVIIATPTSTHFKIMKYFLKLNIPVLVEKPIFSNYKMHEKLKKYKDKIMVGHIEQFNPVIIKLKEILKDKKIITCNFKRVGFYPVQIDENIIIDFAIHDINNALYLFGEPDSVYGVGNDNNDSLCTLSYNKFNILLQTSWNVPYKMREIEIITTEGVIRANQIHQTISFETYNECINYKIKQEEPLSIELNHFIDSLTKSNIFQTNFDNAIKTLKIAELIEISNKEEKAISIKGDTLICV